MAFSCELQTPCIITLWYNMCTARVSPLYSCMQCLKHYDLLFKYMNLLSYQIMIFVSLLHTHKPLTFVASTNFLSCMHMPSSPCPSLSILSIAHIHFLGHSPTVSIGLPSSFFSTNTDRYTSLARSVYHIHTLSLFSSHRPCLTPTPLFIDLVLAHSFPLGIVCLSHHLLAPFSLSIRLAGPYLPLTNGRTPTDLPLYI